MRERFRESGRRIGIAESGKRDREKRSAWKGKQERERGSETVTDGGRISK